MLSEGDQTLAFCIIGQLSCAIAQTLSYSVGSNTGQPLSLECSVCDAKIGHIKLGDLSEEDSDLVQLFLTVERLLKLIQKPKCDRPRIAAMVTLKRLLSHSTSLNQLNLSKSTLGQWCLQAMRSSLRDLRIAAG